jgi:hypothetical protein
MRACVNRTAVAGVIVTVAAGLAVGGCASSSSTKSTVANCSNVMAIKLATGKVLWTHDYDRPHGTAGPRLRTGPSATGPREQAA